ncbi:hypothetical protein [Burkholderia pyrrocinia]|uniref:VirB4 family type IV secretion/conjugal transfer ATPase n=1 Tax=Burkholderia pyrrocinia TaxID=60550 RepID=UPI003CC7D5EA
MHHFHYDVLEIRAAHKTRYCMCYDLKDFLPMGWDHLNPMLTLPVEVTLTISFVGMGNYEALSKIADQTNKLGSVEDKAVHY